MIFKPNNPSKTQLHPKLSKIHSLIEPLQNEWITSQNQCEDKQCCLFLFCLFLFQPINLKSTTAKSVAWQASEEEHVQKLGFQTAFQHPCFSRVLRNTVISIHIMDCKEHKELGTLHLQTLLAFFLFLHLAFKRGKNVFEWSITPTPRATHNCVIWNIPSPGGILFKYQYYSYTVTIVIRLIGESFM